MSETPLADVSAISEEQVDKFFEAGGELESPEVEAPVESESHQEDVNTEKQDVTTEQQQKQDKVVPYGALHEERERRKELARQNQELQERTSRLETTFQKLMDRMQQPQQPEPSFDDDPLGALKHEQDKLKQFLQYQAQQDQIRQQQQQYTHQEQQFINQYRQKAGEFAQQTPDFVEAYNHLSKSRYQEYIEAGYGAEMADRLMKEDEMAIAAKAFQDGVNPAERLYKLAKLRGYQGQQQQAAPEQQNNVQKLETLEKGLSAAKSLSKVSGKSAKSEITLDMVAQMDDAELEEFLNDKNWSKLMKQG